MQSKNEEEEFNTGPLSVLMMSVKNNTQVQDNGYILFFPNYISFMEYLELGVFLEFG